MARPTTEQEDVTSKILNRVHDFDEEFLYVSDADSSGVDAFGRLRVSNPLTLFDSKQIFDNLPLFWDDSEESGGGTSSTHSVNTASSTLGVSLNTAGKRTRQTFMRFNYQPGKSQLIYLTGVLNATGGGTGITAGIGLFDDNNGLFFKYDEGVVKAVQRSKTSGSVVDTEANQTAWNVDKMDGTGPSGATADFTMTQIFVMDYEWLGSGRVRMCLVVGGKIRVVHQFLNVNVTDTVYMSTPNLPIRYQIENDGTGAASTMIHICSGVQSEGGSTDLGVLRYASNGGAHVDADVQNTIYALVGIRLKATHLGETIKIINASVLESVGDKDFEWLLIFNPTVAGTFTYSDETNSAIQSAKGALANTITGGTVIAGGYASSAKKGGAGGANIDNALRLGAKIDNTPDEIVLAVRPVGGSTGIDVEGAISWRELT